MVLHLLHLAWKSISNPKGKPCNDRKVFARSYLLPEFRINSVPQYAMSHAQYSFCILYNYYNIMDQDLINIYSNEHNEELK